MEQDVNMYGIIIIKLESDAKSDRSKLSKAYNRSIVDIFYYYYSSDPYI